MSDLAVPMKNVLTSDAFSFLTNLVRTFRDEVDDHLKLREKLHNSLGALQFSEDLLDRNLRVLDWTVDPIPEQLQRRHVEITGPPDRKLVINALNSGADVFMADFEDSLAPTWSNVICGQLNLQDAVRKTISYKRPIDDKLYQLCESPAHLVVRPRGWHLFEKHIQIDNIPAPAGLIDAGLFLFHNAAAQVSLGEIPHLYLPKLESGAEAALWDRTLSWIEEQLQLDHGAIKVSVLIETLPAIFQLDPILWELRSRIVALNCGRWDYIFSRIKSMPDEILPDRSEINMNQACMDVYVKLVIRTCHRRGVLALGGMAAQVPHKDPAINETAIARVQEDKIREASRGHDGTWVAHPGLVSVAKEVFESALKGADNQLEKVVIPGLPTDEAELRDLLLGMPDGPKTLSGLRNNIRISLLYLTAWLQGTGCVQIDGLMEDVATAEISRMQVWQWIRNSAVLDDGTVVDEELFVTIRDEESAKLLDCEGQVDVSESDLITSAALLLTELVLPDLGKLAEFLTIPAYGILSTDLTHPH